MSKVESYYKKVLETDENHILTNFNIGTYYFTLRKYEKAITHFKKALAFTNNDTKLAYQIGMCYMRLK